MVVWILLSKGGTPLIPYSASYTVREDKERNEERDKKKKKERERNLENFAKEYCHRHSHTQIF